jgi:uncharacterized protein (TIGR02271 family)
MSIQQRTTIVGVFEEDRHADMAVDELRKAGFRDDQIGVARRHAEGETEVTADEGSHAGTGAAAGAIAGAGLGGLVGLGIIAGIIPAIGPVIAGGTLAAILANAAGGAVIGGLVGTLMGAGIPEEEAHYYQGEFEAGRTIVTVRADGRYDEAMAILRRHGAYDMQTAGSRTAATTTCAAADTTSAVSAAAARMGQGTQKIQVREEELHAQKRPVETGEVRVHKEVHTEHKTIDVPVEREEVVIERRPVHGQVAAGELREGEEIRIPVREEQVDVSKRAVVKEEVEVGKRVVQDTERVSGDVRKEEVRVEREGDVDVHTKGTDRGSR